MMTTNNDQEITITILDRSNICEIKPDDNGYFSKGDQATIDEIEQKLDIFIENINSILQDKQRGKLIIWYENNNDKKCGITLSKNEVFCSHKNVWYLIKFKKENPLNEVTKENIELKKMCNNDQLEEIIKIVTEELELKKLSEILCSKEKKERKNLRKSPYFSADEVIARLRHALYCFYLKPYHKNKWNGEHLARLVVENDTKNYNKNNSYLGLFEATEAEQEFTKYLNIYSSRLNPDILNHFFRFNFLQKIWEWVQAKKLRTLFPLVVFSIAGLILFRGFDWLLSEEGEQITKEITNLKFLNKDIFFVNFSWGEALFLLIGVVIIVVLITIITALIDALFTQLYDWKKAGFRDKNLWDWFDLLLVPIFLAIGGFYFQFRTEQNQQSRIEQLGKQESLKAYFAQVQDIVSENSVSKSIDNLAENVAERLYINENTENKNKKLQEEKKQKEQESKNDKFIKLSTKEQRLLESLTSVIMREMNEENKPQILKLLSSLRLITVSNKEKLNFEECKNNYDNSNYPSSEISLSGMEIKGTKLENLDLRCVNFRNVDLTDVKFENVDLRYADFRGDANLDGVSFRSKNQQSNINILWARFGTTTRNLNPQKFPPEIVFFTQKTELKDLIHQSNLTAEKKTELKNLIDQSNLTAEEKTELKNLIDQNNLTAEEKTELKNPIDQNKIDQWNLVLLLENYFKELEDTNIKLLSSEKLEMENWLLVLNIILLHKERENSETNENECKKNELYQTLINELQKKDEKRNSKYKQKLTGSELNNIQFCDLNFGEKIKFSYANLTGANLSNSDAKNADFQGADLTNADLKKVELIRPNMQNTILAGADLTGAKLEEEAQLQKADLTGAILKGASLIKANLEGAILKDANLTSDEESNTRTRVDLTKANLTDANLERADLTDANLERADLTCAKFFYATLTDADLIDADLTGADLTGARYSDSTKFPENFGDEKKKKFNLKKIKQEEKCEVDKNKQSK